MMSMAFNMQGAKISLPSTPSVANYSWHKAMQLSQNFKLGLVKNTAWFLKPSSSMVWSEQSCYQSMKWLWSIMTCVRVCVNAQLRKSIMLQTQCFLQLLTEMLQKLQFSAVFTVKTTNTDLDCTTQKPNQFL